MDKLVTVLADFAAQQVAAGADVIQVFDSWAGALSVADYRAYALAPTTELIRRIQALGVPVIYFGVDTASLLPTFRETGADVIGLDWRIPLDAGWRAVGHNTAIQGNLDPITLFAPEDVLEARVLEILVARRRPPRPHLQPRPRHRPQHPRRCRPPRRRPHQAPRPHHSPRPRRSHQRLGHPRLNQVTTSRLLGADALDTTT